MGENKGSISTIDNHVFVHSTAVDAAQTEAAHGFEINVPETKPDQNRVY